MPINGPRRCIYCLMPGTSQEHVFADWLRELFPRTAYQTHTRGVMRWPAIGGDGIRTRTIHQGHSGSKKAKVVCQPCNNGWMSRLEMRSRRVLMPLIQGWAHTVSTFDQQILATWVAKTVMVGEYVFPDNVAIPDVDRLWLYANLEPPPGWTIWIAHYAGTKWRNLAIYHHIGSIGPAEPSGMAPNTQFTSIGMGHLFIQVASTTVAGYEFAAQDESRSDLRRIWPPTKRDIQWPGWPAITDRQADYIAESPSRLSGTASLFEGE